MDSSNRALTPIQETTTFLITFRHFAYLYCSTNLQTFRALNLALFTRQVHPTADTLPLANSRCPCPGEWEVMFHADVGQLIEHFLAVRVLR